MFILQYKGFTFRFWNSTQICCYNMMEKDAIVILMYLFAIYLSDMGQFGGGDMSILNKC